MAVVYLTEAEGLQVSRLMKRVSEGEREVIQLVVLGMKNKSIAKKLGIALRTVEQRRARASRKLQVRSLPELVRVWIAHSGQFELDFRQASAS